MKIVLSRKGFDSSSGGYASPLLPDGTLVSLPIPDKDSVTTYHDLHIDGIRYFDLMTKLKKRIKCGQKWSSLDKWTRCHLDPDIDASLIKRKDGWKGVFGQSGAPQRHLENQGVGPGDLFLFFGWFRQTVFEGDQFVFDKKDPNGRHIIYGYLQVGDILKVDDSTHVPDWMDDHPHCTPAKRKRSANTIYTANKRLTWNEKLPGYGTFDYDKKLVLTKDGLNKSCWNLPDYFKDVPISFHKPSHWKEDHFQSVARGQEFVLEATDDIFQWLKHVIEP